MKIVSFLLPFIFLLASVYALLSVPPYIANTQNRVFDQYNRWLPRQPLNDAVVFVDIDEASLQKFGQFPWPRNLFGDLVLAMTEAGAAAIALDVLFSEPDRTAPQTIVQEWADLQKNTDAVEWQQLQEKLSDMIDDPDRYFARILANTPSIISIMLHPDGTDLPAPKTGFALRSSGDTIQAETPVSSPFHALRGEEKAIVNIAPIQNAARAQGVINARIDPDGIIRRTALILKGGDALIYPSLGLEALRVAQGAGSFALKASNIQGEEAHASGLGLSRLKVGQFIVPIEADGSMRLYYAAPNAVTRISAGDLLAPNFERDRLAGRIAFIGTSAAGLKDLRATPLDPAMAGVLVHAQAAQQIIDGVFLRRPLWLQTTEPLIALFAGLLLIILALRYGLTPASLMLAVILAGLAYTSWWAFETHLHLFDPLLPALAITGSFLLAGFLNYLQTERERREVRQAFGQYLSPELVEEIAQNPQNLQLGGAEKPITVMFADIRGFTQISEQLKSHPHELTRVINLFLTDLSQAIQEAGGTIDKYIGDCIMAFWNAPSETKTHAYAACVAALRMKQQLIVLNQKLAADKALKDLWEGQLAIGIGVNTGQCLVGNVGSRQRFNYSVMGDPVNIAARLESQTKNYGMPILVGSKTRAEIDNLAFLELDLISLKGKQEAERVFALIGDETLFSSADFKALEQTHNNMLLAFRAQDWSAALTLIKQLEKEKINGVELQAFYELYKQRINTYKTTPPPIDWNGVYLAQAK
ncbi:MAG: CHASE2 domain-containing protein [Parvibaculales bacterium]